MRVLAKGHSFLTGPGAFAKAKKLVTVPTA